MASHSHFVKDAVLFKKGSEPVVCVILRVMHNHLGNTREATILPDPHAYLSENRLVIFFK